MRLLTVVLLCFALSPSLAERPETILPKIKTIRSTEWYAQQASLWKEETRNVPTDATAWLNYFMASKYSGNDQKTLKDIAEEANAAIGETFEACLIQGLADPFSKEGYRYLMKAYELQPSNPVIYGDLVLAKEFAGDLAGRKAFSERLFKSGIISPSLLNYSYNVLMSLEDNAVLIVDSENTSLPLYLLQDVLSIRKDVAVLNLEMADKEEYRSRMLNAAGLQLGMNATPTRQELCQLLPAQNLGKKFYYALTLSRQNIVPIREQLYVVGLASQHSVLQPDNISLIRKNIETRFLMDHLTVDFNGENEFAAGRVLSANYLVPMLLLLEHYRSSNEVERAKDLEEQVIRLAKQNGKSLLVENFLRRKDNEVPFLALHVNAKATDGKYKLVKDNIYAAESEVTNADYHAFLRYLQDNKLSDLYERCKYQIDQYDEPALSFMKGYHTLRAPTKKEKYFSNHPVVNITHDAAIAYCNWLTDQYNNAPDRKFKKVKFRLPAINEWQIAALGYKNVQSWNIMENSIEMRVPADKSDMLCHKNCDKVTVRFSESDIRYPWYGAYYFRNKALNNKGCSLGNFKWPDSTQSCLPRITSVDGFALMGPVQSYFPNDIGLYDVVGNVAEMTQEKGKACGGSWNHPPDESTITSINPYSGAGSDVGFRVFMEVIEP